MYPVDRRRVAARMYTMLHSLRKVARLLDVSHSTVARWLKHPDRKAYSRKCPKSTSAVVEVLKAAIACNPFVSLVALRQLVHDTLNQTLSKELLRTVIGREGFTKKKAKRFGLSQTLESTTSSFIQRRDALRSQRRHFFSIDETSFGRHGPPTYGYSRRGQPLIIRTKPERSITQTAICCVSDTEIVGVELFAGSANTQKFTSFVEGLNLPRGSVLLLDNVAFHHSSSFKSMCDAVGIELLYVPPYSPWFNPIEMVFSIVKREFYRTRHITSSWAKVTQSHLRSFFDKSLGCVKPF